MCCYYFWFYHCPHNYVSPKPPLSSSTTCTCCIRKVQPWFCRMSRCIDKYEEPWTIYYTTFSDSRFHHVPRMAHCWSLCAQVQVHFKHGFFHFIFFLHRHYMGKMLTCHICWLVTRDDTNNCLVPQDASQSRGIGNVCVSRLRIELGMPHQLYMVLVDPRVQGSVKLYFSLFTRVQIGMMVQLGGIGTRFKITE